MNTLITTGCSLVALYFGFQILGTHLRRKRANRNLKTLASKHLDIECEAAPGLTYTRRIPGRMELTANYWTSDEHLDWAISGPTPDKYWDRENEKEAA